MKLWPLVLLALLALGCKSEEKPAGANKMIVIGGEQPPEPGAPEVPAQFVGQTKKDPVCGMDVTVTAHTPFSVYEGEHRFFCRMGCKESFDKEPR